MKKGIFFPQDYADKSQLNQQNGSNIGCTLGAKIVLQNSQVQ